MPVDPTPSTVKRLFSVSGNRCAFPKCSQRLINDATGTVLGKICHITGKSPGGPRHDANQSDDERRSFANLLLLCAAHHDVVDADSEAYTTERLLKMKQGHEAGTPSSQPELSNDQATSFITNVSVAAPIGGSVITTVNQLGGQVAHHITNIGPRARRVSQAAAIQLVDMLRAAAPERFEIEAVAGDIEAIQLGHQIAGVLQGAGWTITTFAQSQFPQLVRGLTIDYPELSAAVRALLKWLNDIGFAPESHHAPSLGVVHVLIGTLL